MEQIPEIQEIEAQENKKVDKRRRYSEGYKEHQKNSKYHQSYYHQTKETVTCPICNKQATTRSLVQHQKSVKCLLIKNNIVFK